jgi:hypothetical protein
MYLCISVPLAYQIFLFLYFIVFMIDNSNVFLKFKICRVARDTHDDGILVNRFDYALDAALKQDCVPDVCNSFCIQSSVFS